MLSLEAERLSQIIRGNARKFTHLCDGVDEETASSAPPGRWSPKEIVSHLCGPEGIGLLATFEAIVDKDTPRLDIDAENSYFSEKRANMSFVELLAEFDAEYSRIADFLAGMSEEQLNRRAHIPMLKESPLGEYPTLADWAQGIGSFHLGMHIDHMKEILQQLEAASAACGSSHSKHEESERTFL
ncbi:MAG: DinB family protein [Desulfomonile tiedjei]|uniref:DinB family protein n=1 Tax=Desulfomonile tiedjei TaxID=2358 RepID=A0A9D6V268_9BACT|nr:DinB family protein [Desulfomonile tiedjei]